MSKRIAVYKVRRPFKYGGYEYQIDEIFDPSGGKFDDQLLRSSLVYRTEVTETEYVQMQAEVAAQEAKAKQVAAKAKRAPARRRRKKTDGS